MIQSLFNSVRVRDLRDRVLYVFFGFFIFVLTVNITVPGINLKVWHALLEKGALFQFLGMFTGGALNNFSICAMGITPYINASIIMQLLTVVIPKLHELQKEGGEQGRQKISQYIRIFTVVLAVLQSTMMTVSLARYRGELGEHVFLTSGIFYYLTVIFSLTAGTAFLMWLGEQISDKGIGNGVSLIIFAGITLRYPDYVIKTLEMTGVKGAGYLLNVFMAIIMISQGQRKVTVQYAKRVVGRKIFGGQSSYIPIRVNNAGVISIIFAISILYLPSTLLNFIPYLKGGFLAKIMDFIKNLFDPSSVFYNLIYALLVIFFTYFYSYITFNIMDISDNMKKYGGFIPGIRPGKPTADYLEKILSRITFISAIFLAFIAVIPTYVMKLTHVTSFYLGSTSLLIIVGVALDTMQQIEARLVMRHYQGFMK
ncbi:MAG: preprotein translocase subunit SecY [Armatimonadetes bacterium]|nr:preprotein translocase subunit SecY [Armatimonadota bacterium]